MASRKDQIMKMIDKGFKNKMPERKLPRLLAEKQSQLEKRGVSRKLFSSADDSAGMPSEFTGFQLFFTITVLITLCK